MTIQQIIDAARQELQRSSSSAQLDAEILLAHVLGKSKEYLLAHGDESCAPRDYHKFTTLLRRRKKGEPLAYVVGYKEFYGRDFLVDQRVLVPRPETEMIIDAVRKFASAVAVHRHAPLRILDLGTGAGCLAIILKKELPHAEIIATDISQKALRVAKKNAAAHNAKITFYHGDLFAALLTAQPSIAQYSFDIIISNPPYLDKKQLAPRDSINMSLQYEPLNALVPKNATDSFTIIAKIIAAAATWLKPHNPTALFIEIGHNHGKRAAKLAQKNFPRAKISIFPDLQEWDRLLVVKNNG